MAKITAVTTGKRKTLTPLYTVKSLDTGKTFKAYSNKGYSFSSNTSTSRSTGGGSTNTSDAFILDDNGVWRQKKQLVQGNKINRLEDAKKSTAERRQKLDEIRANRQEPVKRGLNDFSMTSSKSARYRQIASNLNKLSDSKSNEYDNRTKGWAIFNGLSDTASGIMQFTPVAWVSGIITGAKWLTNGLFNRASKYSEQSDLYDKMSKNITDYLTNLTSRDSTIMQAMDDIYSSMDNLRGSYGKEFVDTMYNYYLAKSGMTSDAYSLLTGNFNTFEALGQYGKVSEENGVFDTLTDGNQNMFNNLYAQLEYGDLSSNERLMTSLVQSLYGSDTEMAYALRGYENELRTALIGSMNQQTQLLSQGRGELVSANAESASEAISYAQSIGSEEAESATSGLRGGTTSNNANLARLARDLNQIQRSASIGAMIGTLKYNVQNAQLNASSTAFEYRNAQRKAVTGALNSSISSFNSVGRTAQSAERTSNYYLSEAESYQRQFIEKFNSVSSEKDKDAMFSMNS